MAKDFLLYLQMALLGFEQCLPARSETPAECAKRETVSAAGAASHTRSARPLFRTSPMIPGAAERDRRLGVPYATTAERARFLVRFQNGVWINSLNNVIHCTAHEILIFVMGSDGNFYASKIDSRTGRSENGVKHSSFFAGQGVAASGEWRIEHGILIFFSNRSGHYAQDASFMEQALQQLRELGVDTTRIQVDFRFYETPQAVTP